MYAMIAVPGEKTTPIYHLKYLTIFNPNRLRGTRATSMQRFLEGKKATLTNVYICNAFWQILIKSKRCKVKWSEVNSGKAHPLYLVNKPRFSKQAPVH